MITDEQLAILRAQLSGESPAVQISELDDTDLLAYTALLDAAFFEAVDRRFSGKLDVKGVIKAVGEWRARSQEIAESLDAQTAEYLMRNVLGDSLPVSQLDGKKKVMVQIMVSAAVVSEMKLDRAGLEEFLYEVRKLAEHLLR